VLIFIGETLLFLNWALVTDILLVGQLSLFHCVFIHHTVSLCIHRATASIQSQWSGLTFNPSSPPHSNIQSEVEQFNPLTPTVPYMGTAIKHPVLAVICNFWHPGTLMLSPECQNAWMPKITHDGWMLYSCAHIGTVCVKRLNCHRLVW